MNIKQKAFTRYHEDKKADTFTVKLNSDERKDLEDMKILLNQKKDSTAMKQLATIGAKVLLEAKTTYIINTLFKNKRKNKRIGIMEYEDI